MRKSAKTGKDSYQVERFAILMEECTQCCKEQTAYLSQKFGINESELRCLLLFGEKRYLTHAEITRGLEVAKSRVSKIVHGLTEKNLIEYVEDTKDARIKLISLTRAGRKKAAEITGTIRELHELLWLELEPDRRNTILNNLETLRVAMETVKKKMV